MAISDITPLPDPPSRGDAESDFTTKANAFLGALPTFQTQLNTFGDEANAQADQVDADKDTTLAARDAALAATNYKGDWSTLAGSLNTPASTQHEGYFWALNANVANVANEEPGVSAAWDRVIPSSSRIPQTLNSIYDFYPLRTSVSSFVEGQRFSPSRYHPNLDDATQVNVDWQPGRSKADHDGETVFSPTVPSPDLQPGADLDAKTANYKAGNGEEDTGGSGCFVAIPTFLASEEVPGGVEKATILEAESATAGKFPDAPGVHAAFNQYGLGARSPEVADLTSPSEIAGTQFFSGASLTGAPSAATHVGLRIKQFNSDFGYADILLRTASNNPEMYYRPRSDGTGDTKSYVRLWDKNEASDLVRKGGVVSEDFYGREADDGELVCVSSWRSGESSGRSLWVFRSSLPVSRHDGVLFVSPGVPGVGAGGQDESGFLLGDGEENPGTSGVFELLLGQIILDATVSIPSDYVDMQTAMEAWYGRISFADGVRFYMNIEAGHTVNTGVDIARDDYSNYWITGDDAVTFCNLPAETDLFSASDGARLPTNGQLFDMQGTGRHGAFVRRFANYYGVNGTGVKNAAQTGAYAYRGGRIETGVKQSEDVRCDWSGAGQACAAARRGGWCNANGANLQNGLHAGRANYGGHLIVSEALVGGSSDVDLECLGGSIISAKAVDTGGPTLTTNIIPNVPQDEGLILASDGLNAGEWVPALKGETTAGTNSYNVQEGRFSISSDKIEVWGRIQLDGSAGALDSTGNLYIDGMPQTAKTVTITQFPFSLQLQSGGSMPAGEFLEGRFFPDVKRLFLRRASINGTNPVTESHLTDSTEITFYGSYEIDL